MKKGKKMENKKTPPAMNGEHAPFKTNGASNFTRTLNPKDSYFFS